jgi:hypothetical protein
MLKFNLILSVKGYFLLFLACFFALHVAGQTFFDGKGRFQFGDNESTRLHTAITLGVGANYYVGDLTDNSLGEGIRISPNISLGLQQTINGRLSVRAEIMWYEIGGADSLSFDQGKQLRNLSFRSRNIEAAIFGIVHFANASAERGNRAKFTPYGLIGIGITTNNPQAQIDNRWVDLRPLQTEGNEYPGIVTVLPIGLGAKLKVNTALDISIEGTYRISFTDYLDDVSTVYVAHDNDLTRRLADRSVELDPNLQPRPPGDQRGNPEDNDGYFVASVKVQYFLPGNLFKKNGLVQNHRVKKSTKMQR